MVKVAVKRDFLFDGVVRAIDQGAEWKRGLRIVGHQDQVVATVVAHLVDAVGTAGGQRWHHQCPRWPAEYLDRAVAIASPNLFAVNKQYPIGPRGIVVAGGAGERPFSNLSDNGIALGIDDVDRFVGTIAEDVKLEGRIDEADVEADDCLSAQSRDGRRCLEDLVGRCRARHEWQRGNSACKIR